MLTTQGTESSVELVQQGVSSGFKDFTLCLRFIYIFQYTLIKIQGRYIKCINRTVMDPEVPFCYMLMVLG